MKIQVNTNNEPLVYRGEEALKLPSGTILKVLNEPTYKCLITVNIDGSNRLLGIKEDGFHFWAKSNGMNHNAYSFQKMENAEIIIRNK